jgi:hypothetical protein
MYNQFVQLVVHLHSKNDDLYAQKDSWNFDESKDGELGGKPRLFLHYKS